jgi:hypothetical protein
MCAMERKRLRSMAVNSTGLASELSQIGRQCLSACVNAKMQAFSRGSFSSPDMSTPIAPHAIALLRAHSERPLRRVRR